jgi:D-alanyl-D-alanine carboxypeptidase (penicillin-binding protein 5/6)
VLPAHLVFAEQPGGRGVALPLPAAGAADVEVEGLGQLGGVRQDAVLPLASVTKLMTALLVLKDHPLAPGEQGPAITVTAAEASAYRAELAAGDSVAAVETGEQLTELQALEALLVPSADNVADILAIWDAGSVPAFVHKMNAEAAKLGLGHTHYADTSGLDPASAGTAADMVRLAGYVMADPVLRQIVSLPEVTLPVAGTVSNYDTALGHDGIVGIKTGNTPQAGGNFVFASKKLVQGRTFTVVGAVFDQGGRQPLQAALDEAERLSAAALSRIHEVTVLPAGTKVIQLKALWGAATTAVTGEAVRAIGIPGESARAAVELLPETARLHHARAGERLGSVEVSFPDGAASVPVVTTAPLGRAPLTWRLSRL